MDSNVLYKVEQQRLALEENIAKLRKSLRHWQNLELDYEGLREEFELLPMDTSKEECLRIAKEFDPVAVGERDLLELITEKNSTARTPKQVAGLLSNRVDYVSRNADTIRKQITTEQKKLNALLLIEEPETREDASLPLSEITEILDEDGNVISSKVDRPASGAASLAETLTKAGVEGFDTDENRVDAQEDQASAKATVATSSRASDTTSRPAEAGSSEDDDTSIDEVVDRANLPVRTGENPIAVQFRDTEEEAQIRREMLEYGLDEVGAIVAELDMQEGDTDVSYDEDDDNLVMDSDFDDDDDDDDNDDEDESEDEHGRVKHPVISEKYKQKMQELEKRLGLTDLKNLGPAPTLPPDVQNALDRPSPAEAARKAAIARDEAAPKQLPVRKKPGKSVAFADDLDIAKEGPAEHKAADKIPTATVNPIGEMVLERDVDQENDPAPPPPPPPPASKPASRFKASRRTAAEPTIKSNQLPDSSSSTLEERIRKAPINAIPTTTDFDPQADPNRPLVAPHVLERPTSLSSAPPDPDSIDDEMHRRQIALDYHKMRNQKIHEQGGFVRDQWDSDGYVERDEDDELMGGNVLVNEETGEVRRVSRFKAARLRG
jgi:unconventional prefoldin RPB5 interactor 1